MESDTTRCPLCDDPQALIPLGVRLDHPHRWRPWAIRATRLYLCDRCGAVLESEDTSLQTDAA